MRAPVGPIRDKLVQAAICSDHDRSGRARRGRVPPDASALRSATVTDAPTPAHLDPRLADLLAATDRLTGPGSSFEVVTEDVLGEPMEVFAQRPGSLRELIANASDRIVNPRKTLPIAFLGSVLIAIVVYALAFIVGLGHLPLSELVAAKDFGISAAAGSFLGPFGFGMMALGAVLASASAINADYFGASRLPPELATIKELPSAFHRSLNSRSTPSLAVIGVLALLGEGLGVGEGRGQDLAGRLQRVHVLGVEVAAGEHVEARDGASRA